MIEKMSYLIEREGKKIWLACDIEPLQTDTIIEERPMLFAENGKWLWNKIEEEFVGECVWLRNGDSSENYIEKRIPEHTEKGNE